MKSLLLIDHTLFLIIGVGLPRYIVSRYVLGTCTSYPFRDRKPEEAKMQVSITTLGVLCALMCVASLPPAPPVPVWPDQFTSDFLIRVGIYGPEWSSAGKVFYDWNLKVSTVVS